MIRSSQAGATDLELDFWLKQIGTRYDNSLQLYVSGDGSTWTSVSGGLVGGPKSNALIANIGILLAALWWHWPAPLTRVP